MKDTAYYERRRRKIFEMFATGHTYAEIGQHFGICAARAREIRMTHLERHGLTYACPGHVVTVLTLTEWGPRQETGQFREDHGDGLVTIWDPVDATHYTGLCLEILEKDESDYYWQHKDLPGRIVQ